MSYTRSDKWYYSRKPADVNPLNAPVSPGKF